MNELHLYLCQRQNLHSLICFERLSLIVCSFVADGIQLAPALHDLDYQHQAVYITVAPTNAAWTALGAKGHHVFTPTQWVPSLQYTNVQWPDGEFANPQKFADSYQTMFGLEAEYTMVNCLNHYLVIFEALRQSPSASVADIKAALGRMNIFTMLGRVQFDAVTNQNTYLDPITLQVQPSGGGGAATARSVFPTEVAETVMVFPSARYVAWFLAQPLPGLDYYVDVSAAVPVVRRCAAGFQNFNVTRCVRAPAYNTPRPPVTAALYAFAGLSVLASLAFGALLFALRERAIMRATAPVIGLWTCLGGVLCGATVAVLAINPPSDATCQVWERELQYQPVFRMEYPHSATILL